MERQYLDTMRQEEPGQPPASTPPPAEPEPKSEPRRIKLPRRPRKRTFLYIAAALIVVIVLGGGGLYLTRSKSPLPKSVTQAVSFPLYYPIPAPQGYKYDKTDTKASSELVTYTLNDTSGKAPITFTMQPIPGNFNASTVFDPKITPATSISIGDQYNLSVGQQSKYAIVSDDGALIFITSPAQLSSSTLHALTNNLQRVNK